MVVDIDLSSEMLESMLKQAHVRSRVSNCVWTKGSVQKEIARRPKGSKGKDMDREVRAKENLFIQRGRDFPP